jgi:hypothetical protein
MNNDVSAGPGLLTDQQTVRTLLDFLGDETKPNSLGPTEISIVTYLIVRKGVDHTITDSLQTLAARLGCSLKTARRAVENLVKMQYLTRIRHKGRTSELAVNFDNLPCEATLRSKISVEAGRLAVWYRLELKTRRLQTKFDKHYTSRQEPSAQRILDRCGGDADLAEKMIDHALGHAKHQNRAKKGLYELLVRWPKIEKTFSESVKPTIAGSTQSHDALRLAHSVVNTLGLHGPKDLSDWKATATKILSRGNSFEQILAVLRHVRKTLGDEGMRSLGAAQFEEHFEEIEAVMKGVKK